MKNFKKELTRQVGEAYNTQLAMFNEYRRLQEELENADGAEKTLLQIQVDSARLTWERANMFWRGLECAYDLALDIK